MGTIGSSHSGGLYRGHRTIVFLLAELVTKARGSPEVEILSMTSVHLRKLNLLLLHCLKRLSPSYVDASGQEGTILNGDA